MRPRRLCGGGGQKRSVQQDDYHPRGSEKMNDSVHCLMIFMLLLMFYSDILLIFAPRNQTC